MNGGLPTFVISNPGEISVKCVQKINILNNFFVSPAHQVVNTACAPDTCLTV